ncbi:4323_t:CDS:2, partial [Ambispora gerdemannii]
IPPNPPTPGGQIEVTAPKGDFKFDSYLGVSWNANVDIKDKWNRKVNVWIARRLGNAPDQLKYIFLGVYNYGNTWAGFHAKVNQGYYFAWVEVVDEPAVWGTGPVFYISY